jgi:hypothetical protein
MEEGTGGNRNTLPQNIAVRLRFPTNVMDMAEAHSSDYLGQLDSDAGKAWDFKTGKLPTVWIYMARFVRALQGADDWMDKEQAKAYVREKLGRTGGDTLVTEVLPLPKRAADDWPDIYRHWYSTRAEYELAVKPIREKLLRSLLQTNKPEYVFCYGSAHHDYYKMVFDTKYSPLIGERISVGEMNGTYIVLLPFMGNGQFKNDYVKAIVNQLRGG